MKASSAWARSQQYSWGSSILLGITHRLSDNSRQQVPHRHPSAIAPLKEQGVALFNFRFHGVTAIRHAVPGARIAAE
jgi:hypothetical protein